MSYQVLARKWRPLSFAQLTGQEHVAKALKHALDHNRLHHAYLFTGTRGVGKTTIARILAKCLNCQQGVTSNPCGQCNACTEINEGRFIDLIEIDAASRTKVEDTREILENVQYAPSHGRYKVYLIDEVHMLSTHSFNALLKTLEEPPMHVKFVLATTDPKKLPITVLSRCLQFNLKHLSSSLISERLDFILTEEDINHEPKALELLAKAAKGSMRDALSLTDQAIAFGAGTVQLPDVSSMLGNIDQNELVPLIESLVAKDAKAILLKIASILQYHQDFNQLMDSLIELLHQIMLKQVLPEPLSDNNQATSPLSHLAQQISAEDLQLWYQIALLQRADQSLALVPKQGLELTLIRMLVFTPGDPSQSATAPSQTLGRPADELAQEQHPQTAASLPSETVSATNSSDSIGAHNPQPESSPPSSMQPSASVAPTQTTRSPEAAAITQEHATAHSIAHSTAHTTSHGATVNRQVQGDIAGETTTTAQAVPPPSVKHQEQATPINAPDSNDQQAEVIEQPGKIDSIESAATHQLPLNHPQSEPLATPENTTDTADRNHPPAITYEPPRVFSGAKATPINSESSIPSLPQSPIQETPNINWPELLPQLTLTSMDYEIASHYCLTDQSKQQLSFEISEQNAILMSNDQHARINRLEQAITDVLGNSIKVCVTIKTETGATPAQLYNEEEQQKLKAVKQSIAQDIKLNELINTFNGTLIEPSIKPIP